MNIEENKDDEIWSWFEKNCRNKAMVFYRKLLVPDDGWHQEEHQEGHQEGRATNKFFFSRRNIAPIFFLWIDL